MLGSLLTVTSECDAFHSSFGISNAITGKTHRSYDKQILDALAWWGWLTYIKCFNLLLSCMVQLIPAVLSYHGFSPIPCGTETKPRTTMWSFLKPGWLWWLAMNDQRVQWAKCALGLNMHSEPTYDAMSIFAFSLKSTRFTERTIDARILMVRILILRLVNDSTMHLTYG